MASNGLTNVNRPTNIKAKDSDIARKLQFYGIFSGFQAGKMPSNDQIDVAMNSFLASKAMASPSQQLSADGQKLVQDFHKVTKMAQYLLLSKNEGNLIQDFIWQTTHFDKSSVQPGSTSFDRERARNQGQEALDGLRTLGSLLITNGQFRKLGKDLTVIFRDMASDAAANAATRFRPSEEELAQIDEPAPDGTWHEAPDFKGMQSKAKGYLAMGKSHATDVQKSAQKASGAHKADDPRQVDSKAGLGAARDALKNKVDQNVSEEEKQKIRDKRENYRGQARDYLQKKVPKERRDNMIFRLKKMVIECQSHKDYQKAMKTLLDLAEEYSNQGREFSKTGTSTVQQARGGLTRAETDLRVLLERFANGTSMENLFASIRQLYQDAEKDSQLREWFKAMNSYLRRCLMQEGFILEQSATDEWNELYKQGQFLLRDKYRQHTNRVLDEVKFFFREFDNDAQNKQFSESVQSLMNHLGRNEDGTMVFKPHLLKDLSEVILPALLRDLQYVPIPRLEYSDRDMDMVIENMVLESDNFMPNVMEWSSEHNMRWGRKFMSTVSNAAKGKRNNRSTVNINISGIQMDMRGVSYHFNKKNGFPSIKDTGLLDIMLPNDGVSVKLRVSTPNVADKQKVFKVENMHVNLKNLKIKIHKSEHKFLLSIVKPLALRLMRPAIEKAITKIVKDQCNELDASLWEIKQLADHNLEQSRKNDPKSKPSFYGRYMEAAKKYRDDTKTKKEMNKTPEQKAKAESAKFNIAWTKDLSILPQVELPSSLATKQAEFEDLARQGATWESPVFSLGHAARSTDIPVPPKITKKVAPVSSPSGTGTNNSFSSVDNSSSGYDRTQQNLRNPMARDSAVSSLSPDSISNKAVSGFPATMQQHDGANYSPIDGNGSGNYVLSSDEDRNATGNMMGKGNMMGQQNMMGGQQNVLGGQQNMTAGTGHHDPSNLSQQAVQAANAANEMRMN